MPRRNKTEEEKNFDNSIGSKIESLRLQRDIPIEKLTSLLGCHRSRYRDIETGKSSLSVWECNAIAEFYDMSPNKLFGRTLLNHFEYADEASKVINMMPDQYRKLYVDIGKLLIDAYEQRKAENEKNTGKRMRT